MKARVSKTAEVTAEFTKLNPPQSVIHSFQ